ncbi:MAG: serine hydrolase, partial [Frankiales bacterium]|nr:serine hydrolase [Frankiales bacterium]
KDLTHLELVGPWYWGTSCYGLRLASDGLLHLMPLLGAGRGSRFRPQQDGTFVGLDGYHAGEVLRVVRAAGKVVALDLGSFVFSRTPYDPAAPHPGGVDGAGWR